MFFALVNTISVASARANTERKNMKRTTPDAGRKIACAILEDEEKSPELDT
jgi:hypothetical protein